MYIKTKVRNAQPKVRNAQPKNLCLDILLDNLISTFLQMRLTNISCVTNKNPKYLNIHNYILNSLLLLAISTSFTPKTLPLDHPFPYAPLHSGACCWPHPRRRGRSSWCRLGWNIRGCMGHGVANIVPVHVGKKKNGCFLKSSIPLRPSRFFGSQISLLKIKI